MSEHEQEEFVGGQNRAHTSKKNETELTDSNEQESQKAGFFVSDQKYTTAKPVPAPSLPNHRQASQAYPITKSELGEALTKQQQKKHLLSNRTKPSAKQRPSQEKKASVQKKKKEKNALLFFRVLLIVSLLIATVILAMAIRIGNRLDSVPSSAESDSSVPTMPTTPVTEEQKVIFVKPYDDASGILTIAELYERYADTVVSVLAENGVISELGSGFILSADGYIATAYHVIEDMKTVTVLLSNGQQYTASSVIGDAVTDLAVLKIHATDLPTVTFGSSASLLTGESVVSIGTTQSTAYAGTLSTGEISYLTRTVPIYDPITGILQKKMTLLQTNLTLNQGNSGAPVFNEYGQVIGMITMNLGKNLTEMGFAIPADGALPIIEAMMAGQLPNDALRAPIAVSAPKLGIVGEPDYESGRYGIRILNFSFDETSGVTILRKGDLILQIDDRAVRSLADIHESMIQKNPGDSVSVTVLRSEQELTFSITLKA